MTPDSVIMNHFSLISVYYRVKLWFVVFWFVFDTVLEIKLNLIRVIIVTVQFVHWT